MKTKSCPICPIDPISKKDSQENNIEKREEDDLAANRSYWADRADPRSDSGKTALLEAPADRAVEQPSDLEVATARAAACLDVLRILIQSFERELAGSYTTYEQQTALVRARQLVRGGR